MGDDPEGQRLRLAIELFEFGERMQRQRLIRLHPDATSEQIESEIRAWLQHRPGAEHGDGVGTPSNRFA